MKGGEQTSRQSSEEILARYRHFPQFTKRKAGPAGETGVIWDGPLEVLRAESGSDPGSRNITFRISTEHYDRANDRIIAEGVRFEEYRKNPVVLWSHDDGIGRSEPPIASSPWQLAGREVDGVGYIDAGASFHGLTQLSQEVGALVEENILRTTSITIIPLELEEILITQEEIDSGAIYPSWSGDRRDYIVSEMLEFSVVNIPMNPNAIRQKSLRDAFDEDVREAIERGIIASDGAIVRRIGGSVNGGRATYPHKPAGYSGQEASLNNGTVETKEAAGRKLSAETEKAVRSAIADFSRGVEKLNGLVGSGDGEESGKSFDGDLAEAISSGFDRLEKALAANSESAVAEPVEIDEEELQAMIDELVGEEIEDEEDEEDFDDLEEDEEDED